MKAKLRTAKTKRAKAPRKDNSVKDTQFDKMTIRDLKELRLKVDKAITDRQIDERNGLRETFREMAETAGFSLTEIFGGTRAGKGRPVAAKFANPANSQETWSGRGRQPNWLSAKLKSGANLDEFRL